MNTIQSFQLPTKTHTRHHTAANLWGSSSHGGPAMPATAVRNHRVRKLKFILTVARPTRRQSPDQGMFSAFDSDSCSISASLFIMRVHYKLCKELVFHHVFAWIVLNQLNNCVTLWLTVTVGKRTSCLNLDNPRGAASPVKQISQILNVEQIFVVSIQQK